MLPIETGEDGQFVPAPQRPFSVLKLGVLAIFAWVFFKAAFGYGSGEMSFAAVLIANADLTLHEFGHFVFCGGGKGACYAGGTIFQLIVPALCISYFLLTRKFFSASLLIFWLGENLVYVSYYMATAIEMEGIYFSPQDGIISKAQNPGLVTDWNYLFGSWDVLTYAPAISRAVNALGFLVMMMAVIAGAMSSRKGEEEF